MTALPTTNTQSTALGPLGRAVRAVLLGLLWTYRSCLSPLLGPRCRFDPSCSAYAEACLRKYGVFQALGKTLWRLLRCHPFCSGGHDPP